MGSYDPEWDDIVKRYVRSLTREEWERRLNAKDHVRQQNDERKDRKLKKRQRRKSDA